MIKYLWSAAGYCLVAIPVLLTRRHRTIGVQTSLVRELSRDDEIANRTESTFTFPMRRYAHSNIKAESGLVQKPTSRLVGCLSRSLMPEVVSCTLTRISSSWQV